jgi:opacity protein-like surface antigen
MGLRAAVGLTVVLVFSQRTVAQEETHALDLFMGYSYARVKTSTVSGLGSFGLNGGEAALSYRVTPWITAVADFGVLAVRHHASDIVGIETHGTQTSYVFGPRLTPFRWRRTTPFAQGLFGLGHASHGLYDTVGSQQSFAWAVGGGVNIRLNGSFSLRPLQMDFFQTKFTESGNGRQYQNDVRASAGIVLHF